MISAYDLLGAGISHDRVLAWSRGERVDGLPRLSAADAAVLLDSWEWCARPGQSWAPGPEFVTSYEAGRGWGKDRSATENIAAAARDPERWGGEALIVGVTPTQVKRDCLLGDGKSGLFPAAERAARAGIGPGIRSQNWNDRMLQFEAPRGGGGGGLVVHWAASSDPKSVHGMSIGLAWCDEFGVWYHDKLDEQGNNTWKAMQPAVRQLPDPKIIITMTPSRHREVRALQADAERPPCPRCREEHLRRLPDGRWRGTPGEEPWRLPRSPQPRVHPLLNTRTTVPVRECQRCGAEVVARVRTVFGDTRDNPALAAVARATAALEVAAGHPSSFLKFAPRGEVDSGGAGSLVDESHVERVEVVAPDDRGRQGPIADRWLRALADLGTDDVVVFVDPAVTAAESSDETGVVAAARRPVRVGRTRPGDSPGAPPVALSDLPQVVGLEDWSMGPGEAEEGAPSSVWAPRAHRLACLWGARRIVVEVNQGGEEVLSAVRDLVRSPPDEATVLGWLAAEYPDASRQRLGVVARRIASSARGVVVESVHRQAPKPARLEWYGRTAAVGRQALLGAPWHRDGAQHWGTTLGQVGGYEPPRADGKRGRPRQDRGDALIAAGQVLLGVRETHRGEVVDDAEGGGLFGALAAGRERPW